VAALSSLFMIIISLAAMAPGRASAATPWTTQALPGTAAGEDVSGISCPSTSFCMAVIDDANTVSAETWNGHTWTAVTMANPTDPSPSYAYGISAVSCTSATYCVAVGGISGAIELHTLAEVWDGSTWKVTGTVAAGPEPFLSAVSCLSPGDCIAVGDYIHNGSATSGALAEQWNGTSWKRILHSSTSGTGLDSLSCPSTTLCFAGGSNLSGLEQWNGSAWKLVDRGVVSSRVLSCSSTTSCLAVGCAWASTCLRFGLQNSFAWNGTRWARVTTNGAKRQNQLESLSCVSATSCTAVGGLKGAANAVAAEWNGRYWTVDRDPSGTQGLELGFVTCVKTSCEAGGLVKGTDGFSPIAIGHS
jgi:hypothetical protein